MKQKTKLLSPIPSLKLLHSFLPGLEDTLDLDFHQLEKKNCWDPLSAKSFFSALGTDVETVFLTWFADFDSKKAL